MTDSTTPLARLQALTDAATPGPWVVERDSHSGSYDMPTSEDCDWPWRIEGVCDFSAEEGTEADAEFIAACRELVPALIHAAEAARELCEFAAMCETANVAVDVDDFHRLREALVPLTRNEQG